MKGEGHARVRTSSSTRSSYQLPTSTCALKGRTLARLFIIVPRISPTERTVATTFTRLPRLHCVVKRNGGSRYIHSSILPSSCAWHLPAKPVAHEFEFDYASPRDCRAKTDRFDRRASVCFVFRVGTCCRRSWQLIRITRTEVLEQTHRSLHLRDRPSARDVNVHRHDQQSWHVFFVNADTLAVHRPEKKLNNLRRTQRSEFH